MRQVRAACAAFKRHHLPFWFVPLYPFLGLLAIALSAVGKRLSELVSGLRSPRSGPQRIRVCTRSLGKELLPANWSIFVFPLVPICSVLRLIGSDYLLYCVILTREKVEARTAKNTKINQPPTFVSFVELKLNTNSARCVRKYGGEGEENPRKRRPPDFEVRRNLLNFLEGIAKPDS